MKIDLTVRFFILLLNVLSLLIFVIELIMELLKLVPLYFEKVWLNKKVYICKYDSTSEPFSVFFYSNTPAFNSDTST